MASFLLLHGLAGQPEQWRPLIDVLEGRGHDALALRLPRGTWEAEIEVVHDSVSPGETIVVGHSLGGVLARAYAEAHPGVARAFATIASPGPAYAPEWLGTLGRLDSTGWSITDLPGFLALAFPGAPESFGALAWQQPRLTGRAVVGAGPGDEPRVAIVTEDDEAIELDEQLAAAAEFRAPTAHVPGGHSPHVRHPELVATLIINWLAPEAA